MKMRVIFPVLLSVFITIASANELIPIPLDGKILGSQIVSEGTMSYMASIRRLNVHCCGASFITYTHVLSLGHCISDARHRVPKIQSLLRSTYSIYFGNIHRVKGGRTTRVIDFQTPTNYKPLAFPPQHDIAVILVEDVSQFTDVTVTPISPAKFDPTSGLDADLAGWGLNLREMFSRNRKPTDYLLKFTRVRTEPNENCKLKLFPSFIVNNDYICGLQENAEEALQYGDAGSPLVHENQILGLFSTPALKGGAYLRVFNYLEFIEAAKASLNEENCQAQAKADIRAYKAVHKVSGLVYDRLHQSKEKKVPQTPSSSS